MTIAPSRGYVIDQNVMSETSHLIQETIATDPEAILILPDVAFEEMIRPDNWLLTFCLSLAELAKHAERVRSAGSIYDALNLELQSKKPITSTELLANDFQELLIPLLHEIVAGNDGPCMKRLKADTPRIRAEMLASHLSTGAGKARMQELVANWDQAEKTKALISKLRKTPAGTDHDALRLAIAKLVGDEIFIHLAQSDLGMSPDSATTFLASRPSIALHLWQRVRFFELGEGWRRCT